MSQSIPILDLNAFSTDRDNFVEQLGRGFQAFGFCGITNHGIANELIENTYGVLTDFFALPLEIKNQYILSNGSGQRGYTPFGTENAKDNPHKDLKEFWHIGRELSLDSFQQTTMPKNLWPTEVKTFKSHTYALYEALDNLGRKLLKAIALYLQQDEHFFIDKTCYGNSILRAIHYPPVDNLNTPAIRAGAHEDVNLITLLVGSEQAGLEILTRDNQWVPVTVIENTIICNIADMLQRLSNHVLRSTTHRVVNPAPEAQSQSRYSLPFFLHPNPDFLIKTLDSCIDEQNPNRYPSPILTKDFLQQRLHQIGLNSLGA